LTKEIESYDISPVGGLEVIFVWLVFWNMNLVFPYIGNVIIPTDEIIFFRGVETTNQMGIS
jgi:hypothetical protein